MAVNILGIGWKITLGNRIVVLVVLIVSLSSFAQSEKEPVDADSAKSDNPSSEKSHLVDTADSNTGSENEKKGNLGFIHAFIASLSVIIVSELGDKTFFIAAIMAMRHPRLTVFVGAASALVLMTVLSVTFGWVATIIPRVYTYYVSTALFAIFGLKMLKDGYYMSPNGGQEEFEEVQSDLRQREDEYEKEMSSSSIQDPEPGTIRRPVKPAKSILALISRVFMQAFTLTFLAEWGDRSQLTTIILAAREDVIGVSIGGFLGHALCTGLAVVGGRIIAQRISVRTGILPYPQSLHQYFYRHCK